MMRKNRRNTRRNLGMMGGFLNNAMASIANLAPNNSVNHMANMGNGNNNMKMMGGRRTSRKASRKNRKTSRKASRKNVARKNRKASLKNRKASRKNVARKNRKASRKNRKNM